MLEIAAAARPGLRIVQSDATALPFADGEFDRAFASHVYGHVSEDQRPRFLAELRRVARSLVIVDSAARAGTVDGWQERRLNDGSVHRVYKRFFSGPELAAELGGGTVIHDGRWFVVVSA